MMKIMRMFDKISKTNHDLDNTVSACRVNWVMTSMQSMCLQTLHAGLVVPLGKPFNRASLAFTSLHCAAT